MQLLALKSILLAMTTLRYISDKLFWNINFSTSKAGGFCGTIFLKRFNSSYKSVLCCLNLILNVNINHGNLIDICLAGSQWFSNPEILNPLKYSNSSLIYFHVYPWAPYHLSCLWTWNWVWAHGRQVYIPCSRACFLVLLDSTYKIKQTNKKVQTERYQECGSGRAWTSGEAERG